MLRGLVTLMFLTASTLATAHHREAAGLQVGNKGFTESVILAEIAVQAAEAEGLGGGPSKDLSGTQMLWQALQRGDIDIYPDYTGTIRSEVLHGAVLPTFADLRAALAKQGVGITPSLGFNNTYAMGMRRQDAERLGIRNISDLARHPDLVLGFCHEFLDRGDGWQPLRAKYHLPQTKVQGMEHELAYAAVAKQGIDVTNLYTTDAEIKYYDLVALADDQQFFPTYDAVYLYRLDIAARYPKVLRRLESLAGQISAAAMIDMNSQAKIGKVPEAAVARAFVQLRWGQAADVAAGEGGSDWRDVAHAVAQRLREHLYMVSVSLAAAVAVALPLGVLAAHWPALGQVILAITGIFQTIPSLALLVFLIPWLGIGSPPAMAALFVYSLLPIVRNTCTGLGDISPPLMESAIAIGLPARARLWRIELPLALRSILAGIKTSAIINVGTATLGALVGAGGFGQPILVGIRRDDFAMVLQGAIPAALLALVVQGLFEVAERGLVSPGLRARGQSLN